MKKSFTAKLWKVMKICAVQGIIAITLCGVTLAHTNYAQLLDTEVSISIADLPFEKALHEIEAIAKVKFAYSINQLQDEPNVSLKIDKRTLREALDELLAPRKISYKVHEKEAAITLKKANGEGNKGQSSIDEGTNGNREYRALIQITGTVIEASTQAPMAGVNVLVKGTSNGTTTDATGKYSLGAEENDILVFSFIGYASIEVPISGRSVIDITLREDVTSLNEVVVNAGYYTTNRLTQTGSISRVSKEEINRQPVTNPLQAMQGRMAGVYVQQFSGLAGSGFEVRVRGRNGIESGNEPLYIIDGVPYGSGSLSSTTTSGGIHGSFGISPLNSLNPNDIESIEVLKDADATAIYGSRGANGVVLITTKKGSSGKTRLDINFNTGISQIARKMDLLNTEEYLAIRREAFQNDNLAPNDWDYDINGTWNQNRYTDWQEELIGGTARNASTQASLSGGNASTQFVISGSYHKQTTVFPGDFGYSKGSAHMSVSHRSINDKLSASFSSSYVADKNNLLNNDFTSLAIALAPNAPALYDAQGNLNWENSTWTNPLAALENKYKANSNNLLSNAVLSYKILNGLEIKSSMGFNTVQFRDRNMFPSKATNPAFGLTPAISRLQINTQEVKSWIAEPQLLYSRAISKGKLSSIIGTTFQEQISEQTLQVGVGFSSDALIENIAAASFKTISQYNYRQYRYSALFGRVNFEWDGKYFINLTGRRDGSSRFGPGKQFANFGAVGLAWVFTQEGFLSGKIPILSFGKLRSSYGTTGNDQIGDYEYLDSYATGGTYQGVTSLGPVRLFNPDFMWEVNRKFEVALELGFKEDKLVVNAAYFNNRSSNQLLGYTLPATTGFASIRSNLPATVQNTGIEIDLSSINIKRQRFEWKTSFNMTFPKNKLVEFPDLQSSTYRNSFAIGEPLNISKRYNYTGIDPVTGLFQFEDTNGDGGINSLDRQTIMPIGQTMYGGLNNSFSYKGLKLDIFIQFVQQTAPGFFANSDIPVGSGRNQPVEVLSHWKTDATNYAFQRYTAGYDDAAATAFYNYSLSNATIVNASFIRLKNVSLAYTLPQTWTRDTKINFYIQGQNIWTMTSYIGPDPENYGRAVLPPLRTLIAGIQLTF